MTQVRPTTLREIERRLDRTYFTKDAFSVTSLTKNTYLFDIVFLPKPEYKFAVRAIGDGPEYYTEESPGKYLLRENELERETFNAVLQAIDSWVERIHDDLRAEPRISDEAELFIEKLRAQILSGDDQEGDFSPTEIDDLRGKLDELEKFIAAQAERIQATEAQIGQFESQIEDIKNDLASMPKSVWRKVAGNKLLKAVKGIVGTPEGRKLIAEGVKKLLGLPDL